MSKAGVEAVITKAMEDASFRKHLQENPDAALRGYDLTPEEIAAIKSRDATKLAAWGVDERISKNVSWLILPT